jgi:hypothetical protein
MARKAKPHDEELPFVALMDTMTNVVGVLIIVLVMIGIGLAKSVQKVLSELPKVSVEEHAKLKEELAAFDGKRDPAEVQAEIAKLEAELPKLAEQMKALELQKENNPVPIQDLEAMLKQLEAARKERGERKTRVDAILAQLDQLKLKLDTTPRVELPPPIVVRLPSPRPMPENAQIHRVLVSENRIYCLWNQEFSKRVEGELRKDVSPYILRRDTVKGPDGKPVMKKVAGGAAVPQRKNIFDAAKMEAYFNDMFNKRKAGNRDINRDLLVQVAAIPNSPTIQLKLSPRPEAGETVAQAAVQTSAFRSFLREITKDPNSVLWFHVCKDSIPAYLGARDIVDATDDMPIGWEMYDKPLYAVNMPGDYVVDFTPPPPPPGTGPGAPPPKPAGPPPVVIAAPKMTVD